MAKIKPEDIQDWIISILDTRSAGYASNLFRSLQQFCRWYAKEERGVDLMLGMKPPILPEKATPIIRENQLKALLKGCSGNEFVQRRDLAMIYLFLDTGMRRVGLAGLEVEDVDLDHREVSVLGKGRRRYTVSFGKKTAWALDRYISDRAKHRYADFPNLWLGEKNRGPMTGSGIFQMIERRGQRIGLDLHPHMMRHTWAHLMKVAKMADDEIMKIADWRSPAMLARYGASGASERARESNRRLAPGDRL
jgi:site-specific recombinase XerC